MVVTAKKTEMCILCMGRKIHPRYYCRKCHGLMNFVSPHHPKCKAVPCEECNGAGKVKKGKQNESDKTT
jgi:hypothetical protein